MPCTAHNTGFHPCCHVGLRYSPESTWFHTSSGWPKSSDTSSPALNARSPAARSTTAFTRASSLIRCHASFTSPHIRRLNALSFAGRFSVRVATFASVSTSSAIVSKLTSLPLPLRIALLEERARPLLGVVGVQVALAVGLGEQLGLVQRQPQPLANGE